MRVVNDSLIRPRPTKINSSTVSQMTDAVDKAFKTEPTYEPNEGFGISSTWDAKDEDKLLDIMHDIRKNRDKKHLILSLVNDSVANFYNSINEDKEHRLPEEIKPKSTSIDHNVITHPGIALTNKNITGEDLTRFLYIISGEGNTQIPTIHSTTVEDEHARVSVLDTGFFFANGTALFQGAIFPKTLDDAILKSFGSATHYDPNSTGYTMFWLNRILDSTKYVYHYQNKTLYSHLHIVDRRSRLSE
jgi:hypothetical protein